MSLVEWSEQVEFGEIVGPTQRRDDVSSPVPSKTHLQAAPMQNLVLPLSLAILAASSTESTGDILVALRPVL